ncbi:PWWP domain-containing protein 2B isoform X1 [Hyaena hyaena]|uniref:PWWP domain-containing protein 2B isoform X1 n=1 Tax=Hyaena hyaena TaxID=95912 RepID=UPI00192435BA|nr:PWWP domain-containing protein 2B isoform X1 [Hyaena hyaena]XP_039108341.1 PWWP domain-containing protein 2B isoform X1 [Hyaena hyaena]
MEPRAGCRLPVRVEQVVNGALLVTVSCGERSFAGILLDCTKKSGLFGLPLSAPLPQPEDPPVNGCHGPAPAEQDAEAMQLGTVPPPPPNGDQAPETAGPKPPPPPVPPFPPYFEGAPFPPPLWLRSTYRQWVPQPPPRTVKRTRRRLSRNRDPGRLALSPIRLRPRQVLCEKCKSTLSPPEASPGPPGAPRPRRRVGSGPGPDREPRKLEDPAGGGGDSTATARRSKREKREDAKARVPRSPAIKISYSTPQGTGEVVEIPSRVHGSLEPFCPAQAPPSGSQDPGGPAASIPRLKLTRPGPPGPSLPPPKIRLKPHRLGAGEREPVYRAELVEALNGHGRGPRAGSPSPQGHGSTGHGPVDSSSGSSGEDDDFKRCPQGQHERDGLAFLAACPRRGTDCARESVWSSDSLDESKSSSSEVPSPDTCDLSGDGASVRSSSGDARQTVPPLTVRLHTQSVSKCVTEDGRTVAVGDIVWGKIHGFPWWPARVLDISLSQKEDGEPSWQEAKVSWFGSPTTSFLSTSKLSPFSEFFKLRFNRKKKGMYRKAITEAANAAQHVGPEIRELLTQFET